MTAKIQTFRRKTKSSGVHQASAALREPPLGPIWKRANQLFAHYQLEDGVSQKLELFIAVGRFFSYPLRKAGTMHERLEKQPRFAERMSERRLQLRDLRGRHGAVL
jgi:hypothetical protein